MGATVGARVGDLVGDVSESSRAKPGGGVGLGEGFLSEEDLLLELFVDLEPLVDFVFFVDFGFFFPRFLLLGLFLLGLSRRCSERSVS